MRSPGTIVGERFELLGELGQGGMATVYLAVDHTDGTQVALKLLHPHLSKRPSTRARLRREVEAARRLDHPNILAADELVEMPEGIGLRMRLHTGRSLREHVAQRGPLPASQLWRLGASLADALAHAHRAGVVHRDVTPGNILIDDRGEAVLVDFGLARLDSQRPDTQAMITPGYAPPEAYDGSPAEPRGDLYALGASLAFAATGKAPFGDGNPVAVLRRQQDGKRTALHRARRDLPLEWCETVEAMLAAEPSARPQGARAVAIAFTERRPPPRITQGALATLPATTALSLPEGDWVVSLSERDADARRRGRLRRTRAGETDLETAVVGVLQSAGRKLMSALSLPQTRPPEERIVRAVARSAGLPDDALEQPPALLDREVVLLSGVDEKTARSVGRAAQEAGFQVELVQAPPDLRRSPHFVAALLTAIMMLGVGAGLLLTIGASGVMLVSLAVLAALWLGVPQRPALPEAAFDRALLAHLSPRYRIAAPPAAEPEATDSGPVAPIQQQAMSQLDELEALLHSEQVSPVVASDLQETLGTLRWHADELAAKSVILQSLRVEGEADGAAAAVEQVESRLGRLQALAQAGEPVSMAEVRQLEAALTAHQQTLAEHEEAEAELTQVLAQFLEIGATVAHCRRVLSAAAGADEGQAVLEQLREEVQHVAAAQYELDETSRRKLAMAAQRRRQR